MKNSNLIPAAKEDIADAIREAGLSETIRGETLTLEQFAALANILNKKLNS